MQEGFYVSVSQNYLDYESHLDRSLYVWFCFNCEDGAFELGSIAD
jgi:hypothetical protein